MKTAGSEIRFLIENFDKTFHHQLPIEVGELYANFAVALFTKDSNYKPHYCINELMESVERFDYQNVFCPATYVLRMRAWDENEILEIFPSVSPENIGFYKGRMIRLLKSEMDLFTIDFLAFSEIAWQLYRLEKQKSLGLISSLIPMNASDIISVASEFLSVRAD